MKKLIEIFSNINLHALKDYKEIIYTTLENGEIPKPYIPRIGEKYDKFKIIFYGKAQNKPDQKCFDKNWITHLSEKLWITPADIMLALTGIYLYAKKQIYIDNFDEILENVAITNYYKFSFVNKNGKDLNPDNKEFHQKYNAKNYYSLSDELVEYELEILKPNIIFTFNGRQVKSLKKQTIKIGLNDAKVISVNDPAWIFRYKGGGKLKINGGWYRQINDEKANKLVNKYIERISNKRYRNRSDSVEIYLKKYFDDWKN